MIDMQLFLENVTKRFGSFTAVNNVSISLENEVYGLLGPNGAGKTTLINMISTVTSPTSGKISCDKTSILKLSEKYRAQIGYVQQYPQFYKNFTAREFMLYIASVKGICKSEAKKRTERLFQTYNLTFAANKRIGGFSGGMRQRLGIAQAMLNDPKLLIFDEPTAGLDPVERVRFRNSISKLASGRIVILSTHIVQDVEYIAQKVIVMNRGEIITCGSPESISNELAGKVYDIKCSENELNTYISSMKISNISQSDSGYSLRIISDAPPCKNAVQTRPNLEDVFLYHFGQEESNDKI